MATDIETGADADADAPVLLRHDGEVAILTLNRPARMNAWTPAMEIAYFDYLEALSADEGVKAIVLTGNGKGFCAGADMDNLTTDAASGGEGVLRERRATFPLGVRKPLIAAIQGSCAGYGLVQSLMCDVRFAAEGVKFTTAFSKIGLIAEHAISWLLPKNVGIGNSLDLLMSSRVVLAEEALTMGLVNRVCSQQTLLDEAVKYAQDIAALVSPLAISTIKSQVYRHATMDLVAAHDDSDQLMLEALRRPDFTEGVQSFTEHRSPTYQGISAPVTPLTRP